jgi:hypothetical protein
MIFCREIQVKMQLFYSAVCQHSKQHISKRNYEIRVVTLLRRFIFEEYNCKVSPLNLFFPFLKYIFVFGIKVWLMYTVHSQLLPAPPPPPYSVSLSNLSLIYECYRSSQVDDMLHLFVSPWL